MEKPVNTFRSKLLASFLFCMCVPVALGGIIFYDLQSRKGLETGLARIDSALIEFHEASRQVHDFWYFGERDANFFQSGSSVEIDQFQARLERMRDMLLTLDETGSIQTADEVTSILADLEAYSRNAVSLTALVRERGFQNHGLVGDMRETIHELESRIKDPELLVHVLMLRRHEKDFIIRQGDRYVDRLQARAAELKAALLQSLPPGGNRESLISLVDTYSIRFQQLVDVDLELGFKRGNGAYRDIVELETGLRNDLNMLRARYTTDMLTASDALTDRFFLSIAFVMLAAIWLGFWLSRSLTRPLTALSDKIQRFVVSDFTEHMEVNDISTSSDEVGQIARNFEFLQDTMAKHLSRLNRQKTELVEQRHRLGTAQRMARLGYWRWDSRTNEIEVSDEVVSVIGSVPDSTDDPAVLLGQMIVREDRARFEANVHECVENFEAIEGEFRLETSGEKEFWIRQHVSAEIADNGQINIIATIQDITEQRLAEQQIRRLAYFDNLTGLATRGYMNEKLQDMILSARRRQEGFALFFIDLDKFKEVNDSLGHDAGDALLVEVAARLRDTARDSDFVARLGGDEFCMLFENVATEVDIAAIATRCLGNLMRPMTFANQEIEPAASIGIARFPEDGTDAQTLMKAGDNAMYAAKAAGLHGFEFHNHQMSEEAANRLLLGQEIRTAIREKQFILFYQPQVSLDTGDVHAWEALVRWQHPEKGILPPGAFIDEVERLNLINDLGDWVVARACEQIEAWSEAGLGNMCVSVNIAPSHLTDQGLYATVRDALKKHNIRPDQLEIEVTETGIQSAPEARAMLNQLKSLGVKIAIDDFGTGYSSLGSLKHLPVDCLKIDRAFVKDVATNPEDAILLRTIMSLGHNFEFRIVAEGVEDLEQIRILQELDCELLQGYFFSKPVPASEVPELAIRSFADEILPRPRAQKLTA